ncbi:hypothetical protein [Umezawaea sp. Da 62-37]|uniref:hypothetical protein n=1 Tax=Umezawaea sp. Da 62-37 TaxID=3075927 RepID=UPI0028F6C91C|nr:hypothetical protein [Umezawaea sp. Da 62-37]WNV83694.1 hypothetical protein RM788_36760 [Umezawaea sp. Da 62-37]
MATKRAKDLVVGDSVVDPTSGKPTHVLHVDKSPYLKGDVDVQTTAGNYSVTASYRVTVLD